MEKFTMSGMPMPPSSNAQYWCRAFVMQGKPQGRLTPSTDLTNYYDTMKKWALVNNVLVAKAKQFIRNEILLKQKMLKVDTYVCFHGTKLWTQQGLPKKMDGTNRIKALHDAIAEILQVDDSAFWQSSVEKIETDKPDPWCFIVLKPWSPRAVRDIKKEDL